jgi:hypothetical protein
MKFLLELLVGCQCHDQRVFEGIGANGPIFEEPFYQTRRDSGGSKEINII